MKYFFAVIYLLCCIICSLCLLVGQFQVSSWIRIFLVSILLIHYLLNKPAKKTIEIILLSTSAVFSILPFLIFNPFDNHPNNFYYLFFIIVHLCYISIFKIENATIYESQIKNWVVFLLVFMGFLFLFLINKYVNDIAFFALIISVFVKIVMFWLAFSRKVNVNSYKLGRISMLMFAFSDIAYVIGFGFELSQTTLFVNLFYVLAQYFIFESFIANKQTTHSYISQKSKINFLKVKNIDS